MDSTRVERRQLSSSATKFMSVAPAIIGLAFSSTFSYFCFVDGGRSLIAAAPFLFLQSLFLWVLVRGLKLKAVALEGDFFVIGDGVKAEKIPTGDLVNVGWEFFPIREELILYFRDGRVVHFAAQMRAIAFFTPNPLYDELLEFMKQGREP